MGFAGVLSASAQEPPNAISATSPSPGHAILKEQFRYYRLEMDREGRSRDRVVDEMVVSTTLNLGLTADWSLSFSAPLRFRQESFRLGNSVRESDGIDDVRALAKWRFWKKDSTALNTQRASLVMGLDIRTGDAPFTGDSYDPVIGLAYTQIHDRHGFNAVALWKFTTGGIGGDPILPGQTTADLFTYDLAYLYRLYPKKYTADTPGALYAMLELNGRYETNGDHELLLSPGIMWEAAQWVLSGSVQLPAFQNIDNRARTDYALVMGVRFSF
ncbi:MAG: hypothetical protein AB7N71_06585 [Phycisphaerae bacterium]